MSEQIRLTEAEREALFASVSAPPGDRTVATWAAVERIVADRVAHRLPEAEEVAPVVRGWVAHPDGSRSGVQRWVKAADGDWVSLDSNRRTSGDIMMEVGDE